MSFWYLVKYAKMGLKIRVHSHFGPKSLARVLLRWWWVKCAYLGGSSSSSSVAWSPSSASCLWSSVTEDAAVLACGEAVAAVSSKLLPEAVAWCGCAGCWVAVAISESASYSSQRRRFSHWFTLLHSIFCHSVLRAFMLCYFFFVCVIWVSPHSTHSSQMSTTVGKTALHSVWNDKRKSKNKLFDLQEGTLSLQDCTMWEMLEFICFCISLLLLMNVY